MINGARHIRVLVADDHPTLREGVIARVNSQPDMLVVAEAGAGEEAAAKYLEVRPDITLMDLQMPDGGGLHALRLIRERDPGARVIVLTTYEGDGHAFAAIRAGAAGYLLKTALRKDLLDTIRAVHQGRRIIEPRIAQELSLRAGEDWLNERELAVLRLVSDGHANKEIGRRLDLSEETIKTHMKNIFAKLEVSDRTHAVTVGLRRGLIDL